MTTNPTTAGFNGQQFRVVVTDGNALTTTSNPVTLSVNSPTVYSFAATYDAVGNVTSFADSVMGNWSFGYDSLNRLVSSQNTAVTSVSSQLAGMYGCWNYDSFGNRTSEAISTTACASSPTPTSWAHYNVTNSNRMDATSQNANQASWYDAAGDVKNDGANSYLYDTEGRICAVSRTVASVTVMTGYLYDAGGTRVAKGTIGNMNSCDPAINGFQQATEHDYILGPGGEQMTEMYTPPNSTLTTAHANVWVGGILATYDLVNGGLHFALTDPLGTKRVQVSGTGVAELNCLSLPFGNSPGNPLATGCAPVGASTASDATEHHFTGKERDAESGNDYFGARYYGSSMGRFLSPDPMLNSGHPSNPQSWNRYAYVFNNPLRNTDPTGLYTCSGNKQQCSGFADALKALKSARDSYKKGSDGYNTLNGALNAYGKAGVDNGVHVGFGATRDGGPADTNVGLNVDPATGNKITTADNPTGQNINVTIDPSKNGSTDIEAVNAGHEGIHVEEGSALVGALPMNVLGADAQAMLGGSLNLTKFQTEYDAYWATSYGARALFPQQSYSVGNGHELWNPSWSAVDVNTCNCNIERGIFEELADPKGPYNVTPFNPGSKLIQ
jgi:RHS repeat-associated protein